jgi:NTE family protein
VSAVPEAGSRVGLVLGGGGLTGTAFHAGVVAALDDLGWDARDAALIVGTSAGSTAAALLRAGLSPSDYFARVRGSSLSPAGQRLLGGLPPLAAPSAPAAERSRRSASPDLARRVARAPWRYPPGVLAAALLPAGSRPVDAGAARLGPLFAGWPSEPLWITAVSLRDGRRVVFGRDATGSVADAVAASCAIPGYFAPVEVDGDLLVDGGVHSLVNLDLVAGEPLDLVVVSAPLSTADWAARERGNAVRLPARAQLEREVRRVRAAGTPVVVVQPDAGLRAVMGTDSMVPGKRPPVARAARAYARTVLEDALPA